MKKKEFNLGDTIETPIGKLRVESVCLEGMSFSTITVRWHEHQGTSEIPFSLFETWLPDVPEHTFDEMKLKLIELKDLAGDKLFAINIVNNIG